MANKIVISYNLNKNHTFGDFVSRKISHEKWTDAKNPMPEEGGIYVIFNGTHRSKNFYVGVGKDLKDRFKHRAEAVVHLGFSYTDLEKIYIWHGTIHCSYDSGSDMLDENNEKELKGKDYKPENVLFPGKVLPEDLPEKEKLEKINLEHLLVRFLFHHLSDDIKKELTCTNTLLMTDFENSTSHNFEVEVDITHTGNSLKKTLKPGEKW